MSVNSPPLPSYSDVTEDRLPCYVDAVSDQATDGEKIYPYDFIHEDYADIQYLLGLANKWLCTPANRVLDVVAVEIVTYKFKHPFDPERTTFSLNTESNNPFLRALRVWVKSCRPPTSAPLTIKQLIVSPVGCEERVDKMIRRLNGEQSISGRILNIRTVWHKYKGDFEVPERTRYTVTQESDTRFCAALHIFYLYDLPSNNGFVAKQDFLAPGLDSGNAHRSREKFSSLVSRASTFIQQNTLPSKPNQFINVETVYIKIKDGMEGDSNRSFYKLHHDKHTYFTLIVRVWYLVDIRPPQVRDGQLLPVLKMTALTVKIFVPNRLTPDADDPHLYESFSTLKQRMLMWMKETKVRVIGIETVPVRMYTGGTQKHERAEATTSYNHPGGREYWLYTIRLYINGHYDDVLISRPELSGEHMVENYGDGRCGIM